MKVNVIIVEDEHLYRDMLSVSLSQDPNLNIIATFQEPSPVLADGIVARAHVAVLDIELAAEMNGLELGLRLRQAYPGLGIVLLSNHRKSAFLLALRQRQLIGWSYLLKNSVSDVAMLSRAIMGTARGRVVLDPALTRGLMPRSATLLSRLTTRQLHILALIAQGHSNKGIARELGIKKKSVENGINEIYSRLGLSDSSIEIHPRVAAVLYYLDKSHIM